MCKWNVTKHETNLHKFVFSFRGVIRSRVFLNGSRIAGNTNFRFLRNFSKTINERQFEKYLQYRYSAAEFHPCLSILFRTQIFLIFVLNIQLLASIFTLFKTNSDNRIVFLCQIRSMNVTLYLTNNAWHCRNKIKNNKDRTRCLRYFMMHNA